MIIRRLSIASAVLLPILLFPTFEGSSVEAQGLFRRLRTRMQSRFQPPPYQPQAPSRYVPRQQPQSGVQRLQPQPTSPVIPPSTATDPARASAVTPAQGLGGQSSKKTPVESGALGGSILNQPPASGDAGDSESTEGQPPATDSAAQRTSPKRASLGIEVLETRKGVPGLEVAGFRENSLADEAGLRKGDVIVTIDGKATPTVADIAKQLEGRRGGEKVRARIVRGRTTTAIMIPLLGPGLASTEPRNAAPDQPRGAQPRNNLGVKVSDARGQRGVIVSDVVVNSPASAAGIQVGDRIVSIDGRLMIDRRTWDHELAKRTVGDELSMHLVRDDKLVAVELSLADPGSLAKSKQEASARGGGPAAGNQGNSVLEGARSILGGLLGGKSKPKTDAATNKDELAFGDDEPIDQVVFESEMTRALEKLTEDPPSLETLELPPPDNAVPIDQADDAKRKQTADELREEIRRLEQRLKELDSKQ